MMTLSIIIEVMALRACWRDAPLSIIMRVSFWASVASSRFDAMSCICKSTSRLMASSMILTPALSCRPCSAEPHAPSSAAMPSWIFSPVDAFFHMRAGSTRISATSRDRPSDSSAMRWFLFSISRMRTADWMAESRRNWPCSNVSPALSYSPRAMRSRCSAVIFPCSTHASNSSLRACGDGPSSRLTVSCVLRAFVC